MEKTSNNPSEREQALNRLVKEYYQACEQGPAPDAAEFIARHPDYVDDLREFFSDMGQLQHNVPQRAADPEGSESQGNAVTRLAATERPGTMIGPYKLLQKLGEGGMGAVYLAEQQEPVRRQVALKIIKAGMDSTQVIARFEQERQALAMMDHPNIARIIDAGTTEGVGSRESGVAQSPTAYSQFPIPSAGRPFFVMELVKGIPITRYCDQEHLSPKERLELFIPVCQAVQHAHQKGIIHRDLKPSNVLIALYDGRPVPKVIDFGVAKATSQKLTERTLFTEVGSIVGTLEYMAPEQAELNNLDIDTRADIYSLGVLLYELLAGAPPFSSQQLRAAGFGEMLRIIKEVEPPKPSTKLSSSAELPSIAANRKLEPARLTKTVRGDLDWIVMKCLEKERARRYETANAFALDIQRYLYDEPVLAGPPSTGYRLGKFLKRNKGPVLAAVAVLLTLIGGIIGTTWGLIRAENARLAESQQRKLAEESRQSESAQRKLAEAAEKTARANERQAAAERDRAEQEKRIANAVKDFLQNRLLTQADATNQANSLVQAGGTSADLKENPTIRELLDRAAAGLTPEKMEPQFPNLPLVQAEILRTIGETYWKLGQFGPGIAHLERSRDLFVTHRGSDHPDTLTTLNKLALAYMKGGKFREATRLFEQVRDQQITILGPDHPDTLTTLHNLAWTFRDDGRHEESIQLFELVRDKRLATLGSEHLDTIMTLHELASSYSAGGRFPEAIKLFEQVSDMRIAMLGPDHPDTFWTLNGLAAAYRRTGRLPEAIQIFEQVRDKQIAKLGPDNRATLFNLNSLANTYQASGRLPEAIQLFEQVGDKMTATLGPDHPWTLGTLANLANALDWDRQFAKAAEIRRGLLNIQRKQFPATDPRLATALSALGSSMLRVRQFTEAEALLRECLIIRERAQPDDWHLFYAKTLLGNALLRQNKYAEAEPFLLSGYEGTKARAEKIPDNVRKIRLTEALRLLINLYIAWDKPDEAINWRMELEAIQSRN